MGKNKNVIIHNPDEVMKRLVAEGYEEVICQPTHIINGLEYDKMMNMLLAYKDRFNNQGWNPFLPKRKITKKPARSLCRN